MTVITRFAPSPTGRLHMGNVRTALVAWLAARHAGGRCLLRIDDTDIARSEERYVDAIRADLGWLGLSMDGEERQSARTALYETHFQALRAQGRVYPCYETPQELDLRRKVLLGRGLPPVYDRAALSLTPADIAAYEAEGRTPHWRFQLDHDAPIVWEDAVRGPQQFDPKLLSDPVIRRGDGSWLYMLPSVIDDADMGVTDVVRGEDHVTNTAAQIQMFTALGVPVPRFAHLALLTGTEGKLSKRLGSLDLETLRDEGLEAIALCALLARIGTSDPVEPMTSLTPLIESFDFARFGRAPARFDEAELATLNQKIVHLLGFDVVAARLPDGIDAKAWEVLRPNLATVNAVADWLPVLNGEIATPELDETDRAFVGQAAETLASLAWDKDIWRTLTATLKADTGRSGKALFLPLRRATTGHGHGPDMARLLPLIGKDRALVRLKAASGA